MLPSRTMCSAETRIGRRLLAEQPPSRKTQAIESKQLRVTELSSSVESASRSRTSTYIRVLRVGAPAYIKHAANEQPIAIKGVVSGINWTNPCVRFFIDVRNERRIPRPGIG